MCAVAVDETYIPDGHTIVSSDEKYDSGKKLIKRNILIM
jgi:hypothetical protein